MFSFSKNALLATASTSLFVLLWSSGAIFSKLGLAHASPFAFLLIRFAIALCALVLLIPLLKFKLPKAPAGVIEPAGHGADHRRVGVCVP